MVEYYCLVTFEITSHAFIFEKELKARQISTKLISTPRQLSSSCGLSAQIPCELKKEIQSICEQINIEGFEIHELEKNKKKTRGIFRGK